MEHAAGHDPQEIELKLNIAPGQAAKVWSSPAIRPLLKSAPQVRNLYTAYYDTPDFKFRDRGAALRLRREAGRWIQTVKSGVGSLGGLHQRRELEIAVPKQALDLPALIEAGLSDLIEREADRSRIGLLFATRVRRSSAIIEPSEADRIEVAVDRGQLIAGAHRAPISEVELELKAGKPEALFALARNLISDLPLRLEFATKAQRGYGLATGTTDQPVKAMPIQLTEEHTVDDAFNAVADACMRHLQANETGAMRSTDPEYVHQARVALRRLRAAFGTFSRAVPKSAFSKQIEALRELAATLGQSRDWDIFLNETLKQAQAAGRGIDLTSAKRPAERASTAARRTARAAVAAPAYTGLMLDLTELLSCGTWRDSRSQEHWASARLPIRDFAREVLRRGQRRLYAHESAVGSADTAALHRLRIEAKKLRYRCQFFASLFPARRTHIYVDRLADVQDSLGLINDLATALRMVDTLSSRARSQQLAVLAFVRGYCAASLQEQSRQLQISWKSMQRAKAFW
jgi:inorganic triphosphatase YgiF